ncbi:MAG: hypothetical protein LBD85_02565 [Oscillospiraceae bacterium]|jgi:hypothetical protein|nr:hypothetical protein [Oscillospiraceae bacterium]
MESIVTTVQRESVQNFKESACIHTRKIFDSCRDKDCIEDIRVWLDSDSQTMLCNALGVRAKLAELLFVDIDVEPVAYITGHYTVDLRYYYRITAEAYTCGNAVQQICGLAIFDKRVTLCGGPVGSKTFSSQYTYGAADLQNAMQMNMPQAVVEAIDPMILNIKVLDPCDCPQGRLGNELCGGGVLPDALKYYFPSGISINVCDPGRRIYVSIGQFSIIRLERDTQISIPVYDYCLPAKECAGIGGSDDPCELFGMIDFPVDSFFPPSCGPITITPVTASAPITAVSAQVSGATDTGTGCGCEPGAVTLPIEVVKPKATCGCN